MLKDAKIDQIHLKSSKEDTYKVIIFPDIIGRGEIMRPARLEGKISFYPFGVIDIGCHLFTPDFIRGYSRVTPLGFGSVQNVSISFGTRAPRSASFLILITLVGDFRIVEYVVFPAWMS
jgi:hypothetical protein